jgi:hypothetical protein
VKHGPPRREARTILLCRSQRSGGGGAFRSPRWFLVAQISGGFWFRFARQLVIFDAKQQYRKGKNIIFKCGKIIKKYIYIK